MLEVGDPGVYAAHRALFGAEGLDDPVLGIAGGQREGFLVERGDATGFEATHELVMNVLDGLEDGAATVSGVQQVGKGLLGKLFLEARQHPLECLVLAVLFVVFPVSGIELHFGHDRQRQAAPRNDLGLQHVVQIDHSPVLVVLGKALFAMILRRGEDPRAVADQHQMPEQ